jgi:hypothetical protein
MNNSLGHGRSAPTIPQPLVRWGVVMPRRTDWADMTGRQRSGVVTRGLLQAGLLAIALRDLRRRPAAQVRGHKWVWAGVSCVNYLGVGPIAYLAFGRRHDPGSSTSDEVTSGQGAPTTSRSTAGVT